MLVIIRGKGLPPPGSICRLSYFVSHLSASFYKKRKNSEGFFFFFFVLERDPTGGLKRALDKYIREEIMLQGSCGCQ